MRAIISVSDKTGITAFSQSLVNLGYTLISTSGTAELLKKHKIQVSN